MKHLKEPNVTHQKINTRKKTNPKILLDAWAKFEEYKRLVTGDVSSINNWNNEYGGEILEGVRDRVMGKTYTRLKAVVIGDKFVTRSGVVECKPPSNSNDLFIEMGKISGEAGSRMRANRLTQIREFLEYCTNTESNFYWKVRIGVHRLKEELLDIRAESQKN